jgi:heavy metal sensor kinase
MFSKIGTNFFRRTDVKMTLWYISTFLISIFIISAFLYIRLSHQLIKEVDRFLLDETKELSEAFAGNPKEAEAVRDFETKIIGRTYYPIFFMVLNENGEPFYISKGFEEIGYGSNDKVLANARNGRETREYVGSREEEGPFRVLSTPLYKGERLAYIIQLGTRLEFVRRSLLNLTSNMFAIWPILLILSALGGWILVRRSLSPIGYIVSKTQSITSKNLSERLTPRGTNDEMDNLIQTINGMIARLESSFKRISEFTADASHELKTPLCALRGEAEVLLSKGRNPEEYQEGLAHFIERVDYLNRMINDLILLSKFDSSQAELNMAPLRLDLLIKELCSLFEVLAEQKKISLQIGNLPEIMVMGDKLRLQQLFTNLIDNAIKYTSEGSIRISVEKNEENAVVQVVDTGIGIPQGEQENIFKRFHRIDKSRSKENGGVGLGLSIAEWVAHAHHGRIEVHSELNRGSTFTVYLPILKASPLTPQD